MPITDPSHLLEVERLVYHAQPLALPHQCSRYLLRSPRSPADLPAEPKKTSAWRPVRRTQRHRAAPPRNERWGGVSRVLDFFWRPAHTILFRCPDAHPQVSSTGRARIVTIGTIPLDSADEAENGAAFQTQVSLREQATDPMRHTPVPP